MLREYERFLDEYDKHLNDLRISQQKYIKCQKGCSQCCQKGDYPFSRLEMEYLIKGFLTLEISIQEQIKININAAKNKKEYTCPFLINNECSVYKYRGLVCRTHGLAYKNDGKIKLPYCANNGLNYSEIYDKSTGEIIIDNPIQENLKIDAIFENEIAQKYQLEKGEIRRLIDWF